MYKDEDVEVSVDYVNGMPFIHCNAQRMRYKKFQSVWGVVLTTLRMQGHSTVFCCIAEGDDKLYRFITLFGMTEAMRAGGQILFAKEL